MTSQTNQTKLSDNLSVKQFSKLYPNCKEPNPWIDAMDTVFPKTSINTIKRQVAFIAQCGHESGGWRTFSENLNYSATALNSIFPKYFKRAGLDASLYHRQPEKIANVVYANRMGNGDIQSGDGWKYRGRGPIQLTGKNNYLAFQNSEIFKSNFGKMSILDNPDLVASNKNVSLLSAIWFWESNNLNKNSDFFNIKELTKRINGGYNGLDDRIEHYIELMSEIIGVQKVGSRGECVQIIQELIGETPDGIFGNGTASSVKTVQKNLNLVSDGIVGPSTMKAILKLKIS